MFQFRDAELELGYSSDSEWFTHNNVLTLIQRVTVSDVETFICNLLLSVLKDVWITASWMTASNF